MQLVELAELELTYTTLRSLDYGSGGQLYGTMEGPLTGERLRGRLGLTNLAPRRGDGVNLPTLRGLLTTHDDVAVRVELDGLATLRPEDSAPVFITSFRFRTADERYQWLNTVFSLLEGVSTGSSWEEWHVDGSSNAGPPSSRRNPVADSPYALRSRSRR